MIIKNQDAIQLLVASREAVLATMENAQPFTSSVNYFYVPDEKLGKCYLLMSNLARHTKNVKSNPNVSLQIIENSTVPLYQRKRVSVQGDLLEVSDVKKFGSCREKYLEIFPEAKIFFTLADFHFFELEISEIYYIGGFGKIESLR